MKLRRVWLAMMTVVVSLAGGATAVADEATPALAERVTALADRYQSAYAAHFPIAYAFSGLPLERQDGIDINAPTDLARWRREVRVMAAELKGMDPASLVGKPEWITWQYLHHALEDDLSTEVCREELWTVSPFGWQASLAQVAPLQPVGTEIARAEALTRWRGFGPWIDQEIANLRDGQRQGYSATQAAVQATLAQLDAALTGKPEESPFMEPATRDGTAAFATEWKRAITEVLWPALERYRTFLRNEYLPRARASASIAAHPHGRDCYRALIYSVTTIDSDPESLFDVASRKVAEEQALAVQFGRGIYGDRARDWKTLAELMRADPRNKFANAEQVREYTQATIDRAQAAVGKMVTTPTTGKVVLEPFPDYQQASAPGGQYIPAADDGSRPAVYLYRNVVDDLYRLSLQGVILHETLPGHHLQQAVLAEHGSRQLHPVARLLFFSGPGEGWATYSEDFAREIGLYDSDLEYIGGLMASITPMMVADLGMQLKGWTPEQAAKYLEAAMPMRPASRVVQSVATITSLPGMVLAYPLGGMQWERMRRRAERELGSSFDVRAFHEEMLRDGMLPFTALEAKLDRWIQQGRR